MAETVEPTAPSSSVATPWMLDTILKLPETSGWSGGPYAPFRLVDLPATSSEFKRVADHFKRSVHSYSISNVLRVENPYLLAQFLMKKRKMVDAGINYVTEKHLFHGTASTNIDAICKDNFDWRLRGSSRGHKFGQGTSFARDAYYATHYTNSQTMIYARVLVGKSTAGGEDTLVPPEPFDTTENDPGTVIVKYDDDDYYPDYVIYYGTLALQNTIFGTDNSFGLFPPAATVSESLGSSGLDNSNSNDQSDNKLGNSSENLSVLPTATESIEGSSDHSNSNHLPAGNTTESFDSNGLDHSDSNHQNDILGNSSGNLSVLQTADQSVDDSPDTSNSNHQGDHVVSNNEADDCNLSQGSSDHYEDYDEFDFSEYDLGYFDSNDDFNMNDQNDYYFDSNDDGDYDMSSDHFDYFEGSSVDEIGDDVDMNDQSDADFQYDGDCDMSDHFDDCESSVDESDDRSPID